MPHPSVLSSTIGLLSVADLSPAQRRELENLERSYLTGERSGDVLADLEQRGAGDPWRLAVEHCVETVFHAFRERLRSTPSALPERLRFITGSPGSGKTTLMQHLDARRSRPAFCLSTDAIKNALKEATDQCALLATDDRLRQDGLIHRLASRTAWALYGEARRHRCDLTVETVGLDPRIDGTPIDEALLQGAQVELYHVASRTSVALNRIVRRYFEPGPDAGRHVPLTVTVHLQAVSFRLFRDLAQRLAEAASPCSVFLYDTSDGEPQLLYRRTGDDPETAPLPDLARFQNMYPVSLGAWKAPDR